MVKLETLINDGYNFFTGVPDSGLKYFINDPNIKNPKEFVENLDKKMLNIMYERVKQDLNENK